MSNVFVMTEVGCELILGMAERVYFVCNTRSPLRQCLIACRSVRFERRIAYEQAFLNCFILFEPPLPLLWEIDVTQVCAYVYSTLLIKEYLHILIFFKNLKYLLIK